jgi:hypothetical protein
VVIDVVGDRYLLLERGVVRADRIVDPGAFAGEDAAAALLEAASSQDRTSGPIRRGRAPHADRKAVSRITFSKS